MARKRLVDAAAAVLFGFALFVLLGTGNASYPWPDSVHQEKGYITVSYCMQHLLATPA